MTDGAFAARVLDIIRVRQLCGDNEDRLVAPCLHGKRADRLLRDRLTEQGAGGVIQEVGSLHHQGRIEIGDQCGSRCDQIGGGGQRPHHIGAG